MLGQLDYCATEDFLVFQWFVDFFGFYLVACADVVHSRCMIYHGVLFGLTQSFALLGDYVEQLRSFKVAQPLQDVYEVVDIVSVHRSEVANAECLEEVAAADRYGLCR